MGFTKWDADTGTMLAGSIKRASSSNDKVWGEKADQDLNYGVFVAVNPEGGVKALTDYDTDVLHGIVIRDIYAGGAPQERTVNVGHFSHGDCVVAQAVEGEDFARGDHVFIVGGGENAGKVTSAKYYETGNMVDETGDGDLVPETKSNHETGFWVEEASNDCVAITLGYKVYN